MKSCVCSVICWLSVTGIAAIVLAAPSAVLAHSGLAHSVVRPLQEPTEKHTASKPAKEKSEPERGYAAFYAQSLDGHKTACGGTYSSTQLTAAHRALPCGTKLRVTNLRNGKTVRVTVNDHGPSSGNRGERIIDLSYAAAQALDFVKQGTTLVKVEVIR
jgi:rare lipoprotein A